MMERKTFPGFAVKVEEESGIVEAVVAVFGNVDGGDDRVWPGAFTKTLAERGTRVKVLDAHNRNSVMDVVGKPLEMREVGVDVLPAEIKARYPEATGGLYTKTQYLLDTPEGLGVFRRIKAGAIDEYSFGYDALDKDTSYETINGEKRAIRNLRTLKLYEYSPVVFAMNDATATLSAKAEAETKESLEKRIEHIRRAFYDQFPGEQLPEGEVAPARPWVKEIFDSYVIAEEGDGDVYYRIPYVRGGDTYTFAARPDWVQGAYVFVEGAKSDGIVLERKDEAKATWTTAYVNTLPDSAFLFIEPGGEKDEEGKTVPRSLRHFPYKDASGDIDLPHLRNAIARIPQSTVEGLDKERLQARAQRILENANKADDTEPEVKSGRMISKRNAERIRQAIQGLSDLLGEAGVYDSEPDTPEDDMQKGTDAPAETQAADDNGAGPETPTLKELDILLAEIELLEA